MSSKRNIFWVLVTLILTLVSTQIHAYTRAEKQEYYKQTRTCIRAIGELTEDIPEIKDYYKTLDSIPADDLREKPESLDLCLEILDGIEARIERKKIYTLVYALREMFTRAQEIQHFYDFTETQTDIAIHMDELMMIRDIYEQYVFTKQLSVQDWIGMHLRTQAHLEVIETEHDLFLREHTPPRRFWEELEKYKQSGVRPPASPHPELDQLIVIDLSDQMTYAYEGEYIIQSNEVTTGQDKYPTYPGEYSVLEKLRGKWMNSPFPNDPYRLWVDYWIRISHSGYGIHDTCNSVNCWRTNYGPDQNHRLYGSHGCINTPKLDVIKLYDWVEIGTKVIVQE